MRTELPCSSGHHEAPRLPTASPRSASPSDTSETSGRVPDSSTLAEGGDGALAQVPCLPLQVGLAGREGPGARVQVGPVILF